MVASCLINHRGQSGAQNYSQNPTHPVGTLTNNPAFAAGATYTHRADARRAGRSTHVRVTTEGLTDLQARQVASLKTEDRQLAGWRLHIKMLQAFLVSETMGTFSVYTKPVGR